MLEKFALKFQAVAEKMAKIIGDTFWPHPVLYYVLITRRIHVITPNRYGRQHLYRCVANSLKYSFLANVIQFGQRFAKLLPQEKTRPILFMTFSVYDVGVTDGGAEIARPDKTAPDQTARLTI